MGETLSWASIVMALSTVLVGFVAAFWSARNAHSRGSLTLLAGACAAAATTSVSLRAGFGPTLAAVVVTVALEVSVGVLGYVMLRCVDCSVATTVCGMLCGASGIGALALTMFGRAQPGMPALGFAYDRILLALAVGILVGGFLCAWLPDVDRRARASHHAASMALLVETVGLAVLGVSAQLASGVYWSWNQTQSWRLAAWVVVAMVVTGQTHYSWGRARRPWPLLAAGLVAGVVLVGIAPTTMQTLGLAGP